MNPHRSTPFNGSHFALGSPATLLIATALSVLSLGCPREGASAPPPPPAPVTVAPVTQESVPVALSVIGRVEASSRVEVRARVGGVLEKIHFDRGDWLRKGARLFDIDPREYQAALEQAEAMLARDRVIAANARAETERYGDLVEKDYVTREEYDRIVADAAAAEATVKMDEAAVARARLDREFCAIDAPITGRAGDLLVHEGDLIKANSDAPMVVTVQTRPILVSFAVPEQYLTEIRALVAEGVLEVIARPTQSAGESSRGRLTFIDNTVDPATGTIALKGTFANDDDTLWPGQYVNVELELRQLADALVVPTRAVQRGQQGTFVFVLHQDDTVELRPVEVGQSDADDSVITSGLSPGETVVTEGQLRLVPGAKVAVKSVP